MKRIILYIFIFLTITPNLSFGQTKLVICKDEKTNKYGFKTSNENKKWAIEAIYDGVTNFKNGYSTVKINDKWGYIDSLGNKITPLKYDGVCSDYGYVKINNKWGFLNKNGEEITPIKYDGVYDFENGFAIVRSYKDYGYVDSLGNEIIPLKYKDAYSFENGFAKVKGDKGWGYIDSLGNEITPLKYKDIIKLSNGNFAIIQGGKKYKIIKSNGEKVNRCKYKKVTNFSEQLVKVEIKYKTMLIDKNGEIANPFKYYYIGELHEGIAWVATHKQGYIDKYGKIITPLKYDNTTDFKNGFAIVKYDNKIGFINKRGKEITPIKYDKATNFSISGVAHVYINSKQGLINKEGKEITPIKYDIISCFSKEGIAIVKVNNKWGFINKEGKEITPIKYDNTTLFSNDDFTPVCINNKWGFINKEGKEIIPIKYDSAQQFIDNLAKVKLNNVTGYIDHDDKWYSSREEYNLSFFSNYIKPFIEKEINKWQKKGKYEKLADWKIRVNEKTRQEMITKLQNKSKETFIKNNSLSLNLELSLNGYDTENETFLIHEKYIGNIVVNVPIKQAKNFEKNWDKIIKKPEYCIANDRLTLKNITFTTPAGKCYTNNFQNSSNYIKTRINYNFEPIEINTDNINKSPIQNTNNQYILQQEISVGVSDVDINIPKTNFNNNLTFAVIIANENYQCESNVEFAHNDGKTFNKYCINTLGIPKKNIHYITDATLNNMRSEISWLKKVTKAYDNTKIVFYYAGHGIPDTKTSTTYLLPIDGYSTDIMTGYKTNDLYNQLSSLNSKSILVFLDSCFSGTKRDGNMFSSTRGVAIKTKPNIPLGNMVVFSATQNDETAYSYKEKKHGMFTYFLLKKIQETSGEVTLEELGKYITTKVHQISILEKDNQCKSQTPKVTTSLTIANNWQDIKLK